ncbi:MAG: DUF1599 domain-containing protein [Bacteroidales bacterium]|jgi:hypothetical protein|nr:DUF1599 domain-containing protein [Bacteroidales bacterium]HOI31443.1 DUF1599 domain-containing protein [Bacteroidales bacterium]
MADTAKQYQQVIIQCAAIFQKKLEDYGAAWRALRPSSVTDQLYIKAKRIRSIQEKKVQKIEDNITDEFIGIVNYAAMAIIQLEYGAVVEIDLSKEQAIDAHQKVLNEAFELMNNKNHDYDEAWRNMRISSLTDIILVKLLRIKQIENNEGVTIASEGVASNYFDIINYAVFALILLNL